MCLRRSLFSNRISSQQAWLHMSLPALRPLLPTHKAQDKKRPPRSSFFLARSSPASPLRCACGGPALRLGGKNIGRLNYIKNPMCEVTGFLASHLKPLRLILGRKQKSSLYQAQFYLFASSLHRCT
jgi:hypothetical protein